MELLVQFGLFNGILVMLLIMVYSFRRSINRIFLGFSIFFVWYTLLVVWLTLTRQILNFPTLHRTGIITAYLAFPFLYIYSRNTFYPGNLWRTRDWIFLLPAVVYLIDYIPYFSIPAEQKIAILKQNLANSERIFSAREGWMGLTGLYFPFTYIWIAAIMYIQIRLIVINSRLVSGFTTTHNRRLFNFIVTVTTLYVPMLIPGIIGILFRLSWFNPNLVGFTFGLSLSAVSIFLFISPDLLYGFRPEKRFPAHVVTESSRPELEHPLPGDATVVPETGTNTPGKNDISQTILSDEEIAAEIEIVTEHMKEQKPFLKQGFTIQDLSNDTGIPVYQLSPLINNHFRMNFANWVNRFRIEYFIELFPDNPQLTLEALSNKAGFISRSTFINAFKKEKGVTPREYFKTQKVLE